MDLNTSPNICLVDTATQVTSPPTPRALLTWITWTPADTKWPVNEERVGPRLYSTGSSAPCYMAGWMGGEFGEEWILGMYD